MTREEHEKIVDAVIDAYKDNKMGGKYEKAFNHGVKSAFNRVCKALEDIKKQQQTCEDCISREAVNVLVDELARAISDERCCMSRGRSTATIMRDILDLPSVTPQPKIGRWIFHKPFDIGQGNCNECIECSHCHIWLNYDYYDKTPYCPICGAKMQEEE